MQRYFAVKREENRFILEASDYHHIKTVMRMNDHDQIEVVYDQKVYLCCLENVKNQPMICIEKEQTIDSDSMPKVTLIIPLLKEQKMDFILQKATELGVSKIIPIQTERSIIKLKNDQEHKKQERWRRICKEASEQCHRTDIPEITAVQTISSLANLEGLSLVCSTAEKEKNIRFVLNSNPLCDKINIAIGPEGGFSSAEEKKFLSANFLPISLGNRILRVETVPIYVLSILNYKYME